MIKNYTQCAPYCAMCVHFTHDEKGRPRCLSHIIIHSAFGPVCSRAKFFADLRKKRKR